jgi:iron complex outermembrane recepter protein
MATVGDPNMVSEKLKALDMGWRRQWSPTLTSEMAAFYYQHSDLRGVIPGSTPLLYGGIYPYLPLQLTNSIGAESYGLEFALDWLPRPDWRLQANTSLFHIRGRDGLPGSTSGEFSGSTPSHMISLRSSYDISPKLQWDVWLRHVGKLEGTNAGNDAVSAYTTLDMRVAWKPRRDLQISLVGQNLLDASHQETIVSNILSTPVEIQRGVYVKVDWKF